FLKSDRSVILINLCVSLIIANVLFLTAIDRTENKALCTAIAALLHYFYLAVFVFMLMEGVELYILIIKVFTSGRSRAKWYIITGYFVPAVVVGVSLGVTKLEGYGTDQ
ncbi:unnamed protein product, partial [Owenia fusiformis]